jgi:hypothetical protein
MTLAMERAELHGSWHEPLTSARDRLSQLILDFK